MTAWLERLAFWFARAVSPSFNRLLRAGGGAAQALLTIREAESLLDSSRDRAAAWRLELREAASMYSGYTPSGAGQITATEADKTVYESLPVKVKERFWDLELALEDRGWRRQLAVSQYEFSRYGIQQLTLIARLYAIKNPLIRRGIKIASFYVFGRGLDITSEDETTQKALQEFLDDNKKEFSHIGLTEKDQTLRTDGNLFFIFFPRRTDGRTQVRTIDSVEIADIISNPDDSQTPWFYLRTWNKQVFDPATGQQSMEPKRVWYPSVNYDPEDGKPQTIRGDAVEWDTPVLHVKTGGMPKWQFGCPEVYSEIDWARSYKNILEHHCTTIEALARFAWNLTTEGGSQAISNFSRVLSTTLASGGTTIESNPPDVTASTFVTGPGNKLTPIHTAGMSPAPEDSRRVLLMVCAGSGLPETFYGDASTGSLATAQSLDRPTELQFLHRQELWREVLQAICVAALGFAKRAPAGRLKEAKAEPKKADVKVDFPSILEHDITARVAAIVNAMTLNGFECTGIDEKTGIGMLLAELGHEDWAELIEKMYPEGGDKYDPDRTKEPEPDPNAPAPAPGMPNAGAPAPPVASKPRTAHPKRQSVQKEAVMRAVAVLQRDLRLLREQRKVA